MSSVSTAPIDQITDRVDRLLALHADVLHTNVRLAKQVVILTQERNALQARLDEARVRIDRVIDRLPADGEEA